MYLLSTHPVLNPQKNHLMDSPNSLLRYTNCTDQQQRPVQKVDYFLDNQAKRL